MSTAGHDGDQSQAFLDAFSFLATDDATRAQLHVLAGWACHVERREDEAVAVLRRGVGRWWVLRGRAPEVDLSYDARTDGVTAALAAAARRRAGDDEPTLSPRTAGWCDPLDWLTQEADHAGLTVAVDAVDVALCTPFGCYFRAAAAAALVFVDRDRPREGLLQLCGQAAAAPGTQPHPFAALTHLPFSSLVLTLITWFMEHDTRREHQLVLRSPGPNPVAVMKALRALLHLDLAGVRALTASLPRALAQFPTASAAAPWQTRLEEAGAEVSVVAVEQAR